MKIFRATDIACLDTKTIQYDSISAVELMERAAYACFSVISNSVSSLQSVYIFAGPGNNGGDALAIGRMLINAGYSCFVYLVHAGKLSANCETNKKRLIECLSSNSLISEITTANQIPVLSEYSVIIDGLFGSGLNKPITGLYEDVILKINSSNSFVYSIDVPSGTNCELVVENTTIVKATETICLQFPKLALLYAENEFFVGKLTLVDIGLNRQALDETQSNLYFLDKGDCLLPQRSLHSHKGIFGHALIVAGSYGMMGAASLSAYSCLRSGVGLLTVYIPESGYEILQTSVPEALVLSDDNKYCITRMPELMKYSALAIGPGIGVAEQTKEALFSLLHSINKPCVFDADALNILSTNNTSLSLLPNNSILTPHPKEFERLFGKTANSYIRLQLQKEMSQKYGIIIILKGHYTSISSPSGNLYFNSTGNAGMATAGAGDVLTGMIVSFLAQGLEPLQAAISAVYLHGLAGDCAATKYGVHSLIARDIIEHIPMAIIDINEFRHKR